MKSGAIYIVDQNPVHSSLLKYHLTIQGFNSVQLYHSAEECLYRLRKQINPHFLITEFFLNDHSGFDFLRMVRKLSPQTRVIFFSAFDDPILAMQLIDSGASDYIIKTNQLDQAISDLIKNLRFILQESVIREN